MIVPGGGWVRGGGVRDQYDDGTLARRLRELQRRRHGDGLRLHGRASCSPRPASSTGGRRRRTGRRSTTSPTIWPDVEVDREARVVDDGDVLTCGGVTSGFDLALHLVEREWGAELAERIATLMEITRQPAHVAG